MALTAGGVPAPPDLESLTTALRAGEKLRLTDIALVTGMTTLAVGAKIRTSDFPDIDD